jgi:hypothetical protein
MNRLKPNLLNKNRSRISEISGGNPEGIHAGNSKNISKVTYSDTYKMYLSMKQMYPIQQGP